MSQEAERCTNPSYSKLSNNPICLSSLSIDDDYTCFA